MISFNRVLVASLAGVWVAFWAGATILAVFFPSTAADLAERVGLFFDDRRLYAQLSFGLVQMILALGGVFVLVKALAARHPRGGVVTMTDVSGGAAVLTAGAIEERIQNEVERLPEIRKAKPVVLARRGAARVHLDLCTDPDADVSAKTEEVCSVVRESVEMKMRVRLEKLSVDIQPDTPIPSRGDKGEGETEQKGR